MKCSDIIFVFLGTFLFSPLVSGAQTAYNIHSHLNWPSGSSLVPGSYSQLLTSYSLQFNRLIQFPVSFQYFGETFSYVLLNSFGTLTFSNVNMGSTSRASSPQIITTTSLDGTSAGGDLRSVRVDQDLEVLTLNNFVETDDSFQAGSAELESVNSLLTKQQAIYFVNVHHHLEMEHFEQVMRSVNLMHRSEEHTTFSAKVLKAYPLFKTFTVHKPSQAAMRYFRDHPHVHSVFANHRISRTVSKTSFPDNTQTMKHKVKQQARFPLQGSENAARASLGLKSFVTNLFSPREAQRIAKENKSRNLRGFEVLAAATTWGQDRIDQLDLPLDGQYNSPASANAGAGVHVYVMDTGIDTTHPEFTTGIYSGLRIVQNIFNAFGAVTTNTDVDGHGTHCAGTIGGATVGVAPAANIYGVKILGDDGSGTLQTFFDGVEHIANIRIANPTQKMVSSMSLGFNCARYDALHAALVVVMKTNINVLTVLYSSALEIVQTTLLRIMLIY